MMLKSHTYRFHPTVWLNRYGWLGTVGYVRLDRYGWICTVESDSQIGTVESILQKVTSNSAQIGAIDIKIRLKSYPYRFDITDSAVPI